MDDRTRLDRLQHERFSGVGGGSRSPQISQRCARRGCVEWFCARETEVRHGRFDLVLSSTVGRLGSFRGPLGAGGRGEARSAASAHPQAQEGTVAMGWAIHAACVQALQSCQGYVPRWHAAVCALRPARLSVRGDDQACQARVHQLPTRQDQVRARRLGSAMQHAKPGRRWRRRRCAPSMCGLR